jgi:energy-coupling factor transporter ATP-binding protein EcfA2
LDFGEQPLTVVYGQNGSGKSGYIRVLKHGSGQRNPGPLLPNVFSNSSDEQSCKFKFSMDGAIRDAEWNFSTGPVDELRDIQIYDHNCAALYVNEENETTFEPFVLSLFTQLTDICARVNQVLQDEIRSKPSRKPVLPAECQTTQSGSWYEKLNQLTTTREISERCQWPDELEVELTTLNQRLVEVNPPEKAKNLRKQKGRLTSFQEELVKARERLSDKQCEAYLSARRDSQVRRRAADTDAANVFASAPLVGVESETWKLLWEQARAYSEGYAYRDVPFPNTGADARCVLCQQSLSSEAKQRFDSFESFVRGRLEIEAGRAENHVRQLYEGFNAPVPGENLDLRMDSVGLTSEAERAAVAWYCSTIENRKAALLTVEDTSQLPPVPGDGSLDFLTDRVVAIEEQAVSLDQDSTGETRPVLENRRKELKAKKWLSQQRNGIEQEASRLKDIHSLQQAQRLTNTQALSTKKSILAETLITVAYIERFQKKLKGLDARRVQAKLVKTRAERGHVFHEIQLVDPTQSVRTSEVLSEGEFRIVSLAAFLADVEVRGDGCPFIFDDPISSLDHLFEEATARRLVELSKSRQVIIFTHRLSLLEYIQNAAEKVGVGQAAVISLRREHWGVGEPSEPSMNQMKPEGALDQVSQRLRQARVVLEQIGQRAYEDSAKGICSDFTILLERVIEKQLLAGVIRRYSREVTTKGKIHELAKITASDCAYFDELMTKYSKYEHSQPEETPIPLLGPDEIAEDFRNLKNWMSEFKRRPAP